MDKSGNIGFKFNLKDDRKLIGIPGTRHISLKDQTILSSGIVSFDALIGGGLQVGSVLLIDEDEYGVFSKYMAKYFLAEGLACKHCLYVSSLDCDARKLVSELPSPVQYSDPVGPSETRLGSEDLKIAWRYQDSPVVQSAPSLAGVVFGHNFDLTSPYPREALDNAEISYWPSSWPLDEDCDDPYTAVLKDLKERIQKQGHSTQSSQPRRTVLRIVIHRLGSPLWPHADSRLAHFMYSLRKIVCSAYATAVVTLPSAVLEKVTLRRCEHQSDSVIRLTSLADDSSTLYSEYNGLLTVVKLAATNTLTSHVPDTRDWAFKLRHKRFTIEKLHLPPELQESTQREQDETGSLGCASNRASHLDF